MMADFLVYFGENLTLTKTTRKSTFLPAKIMKITESKSVKITVSLIVIPKT